MSKPIAAKCQVCKKPFLAKFKIDLFSKNTNRRLRLFASRNGAFCLKDSQENGLAVYFCSRKCGLAWEKHMRQLFVESFIEKDKSCPDYNNENNEGEI